MKKILHIIAQKPAHTGSGIYLKEMMAGAAKKSYTQALIAGISQKDKLVDYQLPPSLSFYPLYFDTEDLPFPVVGMSDVMPYPSTKYRELTTEMYLSWQQGFADLIKQTVNEFCPDIIIAHHLWLLTSLVKELVPDVPIIGISHGTDIRQLRLAPHYAEQVIAGCSQLDYVIALNDFQAREIYELYQLPDEKIIVGGGGFNPDVFYPPQEKKKPRTIKIIYAGKLSYAKGVPSLLRGCELLHRVDPDFELFLVGSGDGQEKDEIDEMIKNASFKITAPGAISQKELAELFRQGDLFVLPSFYEGLSLVVIEALASGLRVVASELPSLKPWLGEKINKSGLISYVPLPTLVNMDEPIAQELPLFEQRLKNKMLFQMKSLRQGQAPTPTNVQKALDQLSWAGLFGKIEKIFQNL